MTYEPRTWHFSCDQCGEIGTCTFESVEDERQAALNHVRAHHGHGLGGLMSPILRPAHSDGGGADA